MRHGKVTTQSLQHAAIRHAAIRHAEVAIAALTPHPRNYRRHPETQLGRLAASLARFGQVRSIVVQEGAPGHYLIVAGHGLTEAAKQQGYTHLRADVIPASWSPEQVEGYLIADNQHSAGADDDLLALAEMLQEQANAGLDLESLGYSHDELDALLDELTQNALSGAQHDVDDPNGGGDDFDTTPDDGPTRCQAGDLWQLGNHRLLVGDSTKREDVARLMDGERAALVVTSPPYNQRLDTFRPSGMHTETKWVANVQHGSYFDSKPEEAYEGEQVNAVQVWATFLTSTGSVFYNHKNRYREKQVVSPWRWLDKTGGKVRQEIIWKREGSVTQNARMFMPCDERIYWLYFGEDFYFDDTTENKTFSSVWQMNSHKDVGHSEHGCAFPLELPVRCIKSCSRPGDVILEPYCGSGTTIIAAERLERRCYATEIDPVYADVILRRWEAETGREATLLSRVAQEVSRGA